MDRTELRTIKALDLKNAKSNGEQDAAWFKASIKAMNLMLRSYDDQGVHAQLYARCNSVVKHYRKDLIFHDYQAIQANTGRSFVHVAYESGTHIYFMPESGDDLNEEIRIVFGHGTRAKYHQGIRDLLKTHQFDRDALFTLYDAKTHRMTTITQESAHTHYSLALAAAIVAGKKVAA